MSWTAQGCRSRQAKACVTRALAQKRRNSSDRLAVVDNRHIQLTLKGGGVTYSEKVSTKKEMVPSDLSNNSTSFRHARLKLCNPAMRAPCSLAPRVVLSPGSVQRSEARQVASLQIGTYSSERPFAPLKRLPASEPPFQRQSSWPIPSDYRSVFPELVRSNRSSTLSS
jgi:hypothetical protein